MPSSPVDQTSTGVSVLSGHHLSRRDFLKAAGLTGVAAAGMTVGTALPRGALAQSGDDAAGSDAVDSVKELSARLGHDPESIFRFVTEQVRYEPYPGLLRGPWVTLAGRAGNSVDQAALLTLLLRHAGFETRYAWGPVDDATADALLASGVASRDTLQADALEAQLGLLPGEGPPPVPVLEPDVLAAIQEAEERVDEIVGWSQTQLSGTAETLQSALDEAGVADAAAFTTVPDLERRQHVWVQAVLAGDAWVDMDPSLPTSTLDAPLGTEEATASSIPAELVHTLELALIGETLTDQGLVEEDFVRISSPAWELSGVPITVANMPSDSLSLVGQGFASIVGMKLFVPGFLVGDESFVGRPLRFLSGGDDGAGGLGGGFFDSAGEPDEEHTAQWVETRLIAPGRDPEVVRRAMFDRVGPAARATGTVDREALDPAESVTIDGEVTIAQAEAKSWLSVSTGMPSASAAILAQSADDAGIGSLMPFAQQLLGEQLGLTLAQDLGVRSFVDAPNVTAFTGTVGADPGGVPMLQVAIDIWSRSHGAGRIEGIEPQYSPTIIPGIVAHLAERLLVGGPESAADDSALSTASVGAVFDAAAAQGIDLRVVTSPTAADGLAYPPNALARLQASLRDGRAAVVPERPVTINGAERTGWWLIDPLTAQVADELDDGRGTETIGYADTLTPGQMAALVARQKMRVCIAASFAAAVGVLTALVGGAGTLWAASKGMTYAAAFTLAVTVYGTALSTYTASIVAGCLA